MAVEDDAGREGLRRRLDRQLRRAREVQQHNLLVRLCAETVRAQAVNARVVSDAEHCLRQTRR